MKLKVQNYFDGKEWKRFFLFKTAVYQQSADMLVSWIFVQKIMKNWELFFQLFDVCMCYSNVVVYTGTYFVNSVSCIFG